MKNKHEQYAREFNNTDAHIQASKGIYANQSVLTENNIGYTEYELFLHGVFRCYRALLDVSDLEIDTQLLNNIRESYANMGYEMIKRTTDTLCQVAVVDISYEDSEGDKPSEPTHNTDDETEPASDSDDDDDDD